MYNTLGGIANMCEGGDSEAAAQACYSLTELLRYASDYTDYDVELGAEMNNLNNYFAIMKSRYCQRLIYTCTMKPEAAAFMLPKLTVQPLVENAIKHGLADRQTVLVAVSAQMQGEALVLEVCDNSCGIAPEQVRQIDRTLQKYLSEGAVQDITEPLKASFKTMPRDAMLLRRGAFIIIIKEQRWYNADKQTARKQDAQLSKGRAARQRGGDILPVGAHHRPI